MLKAFLSQAAYARRVPIRWMSLQEYQSKKLLEKSGCSVQNFFVVNSESAIEEQFSGHDYKEYAVKAQLLAGGRGKGRFIGGPTNFGGVFITQSKKDAVEASRKMIGKRLITKQTTEDGVLILKVLVAESVPITRETYLAVVMSSESNGPMIIASSAGGMDIEEVAEKHPELLLREPVDIAVGVTAEQCNRIAASLKFTGDLKGKVASEIQRLYDLFIKSDASLLEINPLAETSDKRGVYCIDAKLTLDDSAQFRHQELFAMAEDITDEREARAKKCGLNYVGMDGDIACLVNGAGLAMATMDIIKLNGGEPANFLDVGGTVTEKQVLEAFEIITSSPDVKAVFVNIFGGIVNCATIAKGVIGALKKKPLTVPLVVRLEGTNSVEAQKLLSTSGLPLQSTTDFDTAAKTVVALARSVDQQIVHAVG